MVNRSRPSIKLNKDGTVVIRGITVRDWSSLATKISLHCYSSEDEWKAEQLEKQREAADYAINGDAGMAKVVRENIAATSAWHREMRRIADLLDVEFKALGRGDV